MSDCFLDCNNIGIFGGTFNPVHNGHIMLIKQTLAQYDFLERLIILPNNCPAYKDNCGIVSNDDRIAMLKLACADIDDVYVSELEMRRGGITYTYDTLTEISNINSGLKVYFIIGADSLMNIRTWYRYEDVLRMCTLLVARRKQNYKQMSAFLKELKKDIPAADVRFIETEYNEASSSAIRQEISKGIMPAEHMPLPVCEYIANNNLYGWKCYES